MGASGYTWGTAGVAQLVEHELPKLGVTGSTPAARSIHPEATGNPGGFSLFGVFFLRRDPGAVNRGG